MTDKAAARQRAIELIAVIESDGGWEDADPAARAEYRLALQGAGIPYETDEESDFWAAHTPGPR